MNILKKFSQKEANVYGVLNPQPSNSLYFLRNFKAGSNLKAYTSFGSQLKETNYYTVRTCGQLLRDLEYF